MATRLSHQVLSLQLQSIPSTLQRSFRQIKPRLEHKHGKKLKPSLSAQDYVLQAQTAWTVSSLALHLKFSSFTSTRHPRSRRNCRELRYQRQFPSSTPRPRPRSQHPQNRPPRMLDPLQHPRQPLVLPPRTRLLLLLFGVHPRKGMEILLAPLHQVIRAPGRRRPLLSLPTYAGFM